MQDNSGCLLKFISEGRGAVTGFNDEILLDGEGYHSTAI